MASLASSDGLVGTRSPAQYLWSPYTFTSFLGSPAQREAAKYFLGAVHILRNTGWGGVFPIYYNSTRGRGVFPIYYNTTRGRGGSLGTPNLYYVIYGWPLNGGILSHVLVVVGWIFLAVLGCTVLYWAVLGCKGLYWAALGCIGLH